jgi:hypothetical protein
VLVEQAVSWNTDLNVSFFTFPSEGSSNSWSIVVWTLLISMKLSLIVFSLMFVTGAQINDQSLIISSDHQITLLKWWRKLTSIMWALGHDCVLDYCHCFYFETSKYKILCRHQWRMNAISRSHSSTGISPCVQIKMKGKPKIVVVKVINI